jgi:sporulation protein YlmC with PRC-barrel domain
LMRKFMLSSVSALALTLAGAAYADDATTTDTMNDNASYGSYNASGDAFNGQIAGGYTAEDLIGADIENTNGDTIDEVSDLLIDQNNEVTHVLVDVGGVLGIGTKTVALPIEELQVPQGSVDEPVFITSMTEDQLEALPAYVETDGMYSMDVNVDTSND